MKEATLIQVVSTRRCPDFEFTLPRVADRVTILRSITAAYPEISLLDIIPGRRYTYLRTDGVGLRE